jgi:hypothetical protein
VVSEEGHRLESREVVAPLRWVEASGPAVWHRAGVAGWMRGTSPATTSPLGLVQLPAGAGPVWYWPALPTLAAHALTAVFAVGAARRMRHHR